MTFKLGSQFSCLATLETQFQIAIGKHVLYQKANCYKGMELQIDDEEDPPPIKFIKARPGCLFGNELEALTQKTKLTNLDLYAMKRFYRLKEYCSSLEPDEIPPIDVAHHEVGQYYQTLNHSCFSQETSFNIVCVTSWKFLSGIFGNDVF